MGSSDAVRFRPKEVGEALETLESLRVEGLNTSKLAREGLRALLPEVTKAEEKLAVWNQFRAGEISEDAARVLLGDEFETMQAEAEQMEAAVADDTSDLVQ
ncbi:hypothetical protein NDI54_02105 [Haloarcula sp. S1AR25-5A]|uniref:Uncharacterized protein n=1 Tax=Haloarcula terrestris TaxID=2950533 RepID=A0AAE4EUA8_9EURY|nr:hypothetical protein [Haloarcula terrestris]MDS0220137.1 hypothetical protein [Haloarcula terrestris]